MQTSGPLHTDAPRATALFDVDGNMVRATELSRGPWDPRACHGGPVGAVLARAVVGHDDAEQWQVARLTLELLRPVPVEVDLILHTEIERPGRKVSLIGASLSLGDSEVARVRALRIRRASLDLPEEANLAADEPLSPPSESRPGAATWALTDQVAFHSHACEHRFVLGSWAVPGPVDCWIRLSVPVVDGEDPSGPERVAAAADFGNGVSSSLDTTRWTFINPDLTVHLLRPPVGEWIGMRTSSRYATEGAGLAESELHDEAGRLGRSCQSLLIEQRDDAGSTEGSR